MCTKGLKKWALLLTFWVALELSPLKADDQTINGDLTVTGTSDIQGNALALGTRSDNSYPGLLNLYTDGTTSTPSVLEFDANRSSNVWKWQQNGGAVLQLQMSLNSNSHNELVLYDQSTTPNANIILNPIGTSTFANSVTANGIDNEMPNQTLVNANSVLTESLGDSRYVSSSSFSIGSVYSTTFARSPGYFPTAELNGGVATAPLSFAEGASQATGFYSVAMGKASATGPGATALGWFSNASGNGATALGGAAASGLSSTAMGGGSANGLYSTAMGRSTASGSYSTAMGRSTASGLYSSSMGTAYASGNNSIAMGRYTSALGNYSTSSGYRTVAASSYSTAIGSVNIGGGDPINWVPTDPLFEIGNGTASSYYTYPNTSSAYYLALSGQGPWGYTIPSISSDAFVVYKNGDTLVQGNLTAQASISTSGSVSAASLNTTGAVNATSVSATATVTSPTFITTAPAGDIPMYAGN